MRKLFVLFLILIFTIPALTVSAQETTVCDILKQAPPPLAVGATSAQTLENSARQMAQLGDYNTAITLFTQALNVPRD
jgi:hypothetical protein